jgi:1-acyl-sn-glycerol-3-phosphate acyltransferase
MGYKLARLLINLFVRLTTNTEVYGLEKLPEEGGFIIAANHLGRMDVPLVYYYLNREDIIMLAAEKYREVPLTHWFGRQLNAIWLDRFNADVSALRETLKRLRDGGVLVLAPEGTRSPTGALIEGKPGASYLAAKAGVPIVPAALFGSEDSKVIAQLRRLKRPHITLRAGDSFMLPPIRGKNRDAILMENTDEIMCRIAALLPPSYRGVYSDHPRLNELLAESPPDNFG